MSTPIPELIAEELVSRLGNILEMNGYPFNVASVSRMNRRANKQLFRNHEIIVEQGESAYNPGLTHAGNPAAIAYDLTFTILGFIRNPDNSTDPDSTKENDMEASIKKAVVSSSDWHNFDGNAIIADWGQTEPFVSAEGDHAGVAVPLVVTYRVSETDPFTVRV